MSNPDSGCQSPLKCDAKLEIIDSWKIGNGKDRVIRYGFLGKIKLPEDVVDSGEPFSVLIRFSRKVTNGHFQLWNMRFWNFYNGGYEVLLHSKYWNTDTYDKYSIGLITEGMNVQEFPELLFWTERKTVC